MPAAPLGASNPALRRLRRLSRRASERRAAAVTVLEGARVIEGALARDARLVECFVDVELEERHRTLLRRLDSVGVPRRSVAPGALDRVGTVVTAPGLLAVAELPIAGGGAEAFAGATLAAVAVDVHDPGNAGALVRSAEAAGATAVVFAGDPVDLRNPKVARASAGAVFGVALGESDDPVTTLDALGELDFRRVAAVARGGRAPEALDLVGPTALVLGAEDRGLPRELLDRCDEEMTVPMAEPAESLNVATAAAVGLFEAARQRRREGTR